MIGASLRDRRWSVGLSRALLLGAFDRLPGDPARGWRRHGGGRMGAHDARRRRAGLPRGVDERLHRRAASRSPSRPSSRSCSRRYLSRPLRPPEHGGRELAAGDLTHRVDVNGRRGRGARRGLQPDGRLARARRGAAAQARRRRRARVAQPARRRARASRGDGRGRPAVASPRGSTRSSTTSSTSRRSSTTCRSSRSRRRDAALRHAARSISPRSLRARRIGSGRSSPRASCSFPRSEPEPLVVIGDERRLAQVVRNLLSNAVRHTAARLGHRDGRRRGRAGGAARDRHRRGHQCR